MAQIKALVTSLTMTFLVTAVGCTTTPYHDKGRVYQPHHGKVYQSKRHNSNKYNNKKNKSIHKKANSAAAEQMAVRKLQAMGYRVEKADYKEKQGVVKTTAYRGGSKYKIDLKYPGMNVVKMKKD